AFTDLLHRDQRRPGKHFGVLRLVAELLESAHLGEGKPGRGRRVLQIICTPLQDGVAYGFRAGVAPQKTERASRQLGVNIYGDDMPPIARLVKQISINERVQGLLKDYGRTPVDGFPFELEETAEAPQRLADIDSDVLPLAGAVSPQRRHRHGL